MRVPGKSKIKRFSSLTILLPVLIMISFSMCILSGCEKAPVPGRRAAGVEQDADTAQHVENSLWLTGLMNINLAFTVSLAITCGFRKRYLPSSSEIYSKDKEINRKKYKDFLMTEVPKCTRVVIRSAAAGT